MDRNPGGLCDENVRPALGSLPAPHVHRVFHYDTQGRRIGSDDPDTDNPALVSTDPTRATWRYLFNRAGDLAAVRDPRGCGQNFFYDLGGRLLGEQYVGCSEAYSAADVLPVESISGGSVEMGVTNGPLSVDVRYFYDDDPTWIAVQDHGGGLAGRATGVSDRGQRSGVGYDARGNAVWTARQMAVISDVPPMTGSNGARPSWDETTPSARDVQYDEDHTYVRTARFDHAGRGLALVLAQDFTWGPTGGTGTAPTIGGELVFGHRGLPISARATIGCDPVDLEDCGANDRHPSVANIEYTRDGLPFHTEWGDANGTHPSSDSSTTYDVRRRPTDMITTRAPTGMSGLAAVSEVVNQHLAWDEASNLIAIEDGRPGAEWDSGHRPQTVHVSHDALYRVTGAEFSYTQDDDSTSPSDTATDWRDTQAAIVSAHVDPMEVEPAGMIPSLPAERVQELDWSWDWLGNTTSWTEGATDPTNFYERAIGGIQNGNGVYGATLRPSALYLATDIPYSGVSSLPSGSSAGWVEVDYGVGGNVTAMTVHGRCTDASPAVCADFGSNYPPSMRAMLLRANCACANEQHYDYRWDELDRLSEARRWDRNSATMGAWDLAVRQRYLYDGANVRTIKQTTEPVDEGEQVSGGESDERIALYVYAGDYEVRGLERGLVGYTARTGTNQHVETQFVVAGARLVWRHENDGEAAHRRLTVPLTDVIQTTAATLDVLTGDLVEASTYYPNGALESIVVDESDPSALEPRGFTGKEGDEEVGVTYFGERYLISRIGRWASPDPLHIHAGGGGTALNSYHYVAGNLLQTRDPLGLDPPGSSAAPEPSPTPTPAQPSQDPRQGGATTGRFQKAQAPATARGGLRLPNILRSPAAAMTAGAASYALVIGLMWLGADAIVDSSEGLLQQPQADPSTACRESGRCGADGGLRQSGTPDSPDELAQSGSGSGAARPEGQGEGSDDPQPAPAASGGGECGPGGDGPTLFSNRHPADQPRPRTEYRTLSIDDVLGGRSGRRFTYVVTAEGQLVMSRPRGTSRGAGHVDLARGGDVRAAGEITVRPDGTLEIDNSSGHYEPHGDSAECEALGAFSRVIEVRAVHRKAPSSILNDMRSEWVLCRRCI